MILYLSFLKVCKKRVGNMFSKGAYLLNITKKLWRRCFLEAELGNERRSHGLYRNGLLLPV